MIKRMATIALGLAVTVVSFYGTSLLLYNMLYTETFTWHTAPDMIVVGVMGLCLVLCGVVIIVSEFTD